MPTSNPRVTAYIQPSNNKNLEAFQRKNGFSASQAIDRILTEYFTGDTPSIHGNIPEQCGTSFGVTPDDIESLIECKVEERTRIIVDSLNELLSALQVKVRDIDNRLLYVECSSLENDFPSDHISRIDGEIHEESVSETWQCWAINQLEEKKVLLVKECVTEQECKDKAIKTFSLWDVDIYSKEDGWEIIYRQDSALDIAKFYQKSAEDEAKFHREKSNEFLQEIRELKAKLAECEKQKIETISHDRQHQPIANLYLYKLVKEKNPKSNITQKDCKIIAEAINDGTIIPGDAAEAVQRYKTEAEATSKTMLEWESRYNNLRDRTGGKNSG